MKSLELKSIINKMKNSRHGLKADMRQQKKEAVHLEREQRNYSV